MFVSKRRWILKTCGTTTPLQCLEPLLSMAFEIGGYSEIEDFFYSRKNYKRPELQVSPHRGFEEEVAFLDQFFDDGRAYCLGSVNRECWYLYTVCRRGVGEVLVDELSLAQNMMVPDPDQTIEVLMTDLDPEIMAMFTKEMSSDAKDATLVSFLKFLWVGRFLQTKINF
jgi:S-adenosylmethionine decarboxylase